LVDVAPTLSLSSIPDWKFMSNWYSDLSSSKAKQDFEVKEVVAELLKDKSNLTDLEKAKLIYNYIASNIAYSNVPFMHGAIIPQKAARTLATKLGDCKDVSTLYVAMCKEAGFQSLYIIAKRRR
jgi:transglutaminase-like putative cysteine protease